MIPAAIRMGRIYRGGRELFEILTRLNDKWRESEGRQRKLRIERGLALLADRIYGRRQRVQK